MIRCESKKIHQIGMCLEEIGTPCRNMLTIPSSPVNVIGETCMTLNEEENLHCLIFVGFFFVINNYMSFENYEANGYMHDLKLLLILH